MTEEPEETSPTTPKSSKPTSKNTPKKKASKPLPKEVENEEVIFRPNEGPQTDFLSATEVQVLYGGAAGGGKSYAILADPVRHFNHPKFNGLLLRRSTEELRELIRESKTLYKRAFPKAKWNERDKTWTFPSGAQLWMSYLDRDDDVLRYQGQAFTWIGFDELTQWPTPHAWDYMSSRLRTTAPDLQVYQRATTNPGGPGHWWVKKMFIDPAPFNSAFWATDISTGEVIVDSEVGSPTEGEPLTKRRFIPAALKDNPYLVMDDKYRRQLMSLPEHQRKQLLYGDWDVAEGAAFTEWKRHIHTCEPFQIPHDWAKFRACDYGYGSYSGVLWFAVEPKTNIIYVYRELYVSKVLAVDLADMVKSAEAGESVRYGVLDSSLWHQRGDTGPSLAEQMIARGCRWRPSDRSKGSRVAGKNEIHRLLQIDEFTNEPRIQIFDTCTNLVAQLPLIPLDKKNPEDVDTNYAHDHLYDALRYGVMSRPSSNTWDFSFNNGASDYAPVDKIFGY